jgi:hypothetical protein
MRKRPKRRQQTGDGLPTSVTLTRDPLNNYGNWIVSLWGATLAMLTGALFALTKGLSV